MYRLICPKVKPQINWEDERVVGSFHAVKVADNPFMVTAFTLLHLSFAHNAAFDENVIIKHHFNSLSFLLFNLNITH